MADDFDDDMDGRLVIATTDDDERMDCSDRNDNDEQHNKNASTLTIDPKLSPIASSTEKIADEIVPDSLQQFMATKEDSMEDGELLDEEDDQEEAKNAENKPEKSKTECTTENVDAKKQQKPSFEETTQQQSRSGVHNFVGRPKKKMVDKSTCVFTRPNGHGNLDEHLLAMRPGTSLTIDVTIICKAGGNTLYFCAKWKGRDYHGVLTDGEPLYSHLCAQKRAHHAEKTGGGPAGDGGSGNGPANSNMTPTMGKQRGGKRGGHSGKAIGNEKRARNGNGLNFQN